MSSQPANGEQLQMEVANPYIIGDTLWMVMKMLKPSFLNMVHQPDGHYNVYFTFAHSFCKLLFWSVVRFVVLPH